jgi:hypothetical protein
MAKVNDTKKWAKKQLFYMFRDKRDFLLPGTGRDLDQARIERLFQRACDQWAPIVG